MGDERQEWRQADSSGGCAAEWRAAEWREDASGWVYGSGVEVGVGRKQKGNEKSWETPRAQFQLGLDGHGAVLTWEWLKRLCLREETERQQEQEILSKTSCGSLTLDIWASNVSSNVTSSEGPSQPLYHCLHLPLPHSLSIVPIIFYPRLVCAYLWGITTLSPKQ